MAMIREAFHRTPWASISTSVQPVGNRTLVTLPVYYQVQWGAAGYQPGEIEPIDPAQMLGYRVDIRPTLIGYSYVFGDGTSFGPTKEPGGVYPTGSITHTYTTPGSYAARIDATLSGEFRIDGGPWTPIPEQVTLPGIPTTIEVLTARAVLVNG